MNSEINFVTEKMTFHRGEAFAELTRLGEEGERFDVVVADPPAFVKSKRDLKPGLKGYRKLVRLAAGLVSVDGLLFVASCSYHVDHSAFAEVVRGGLRDARRGGRILYSGGAGSDHPVHPYTRGLLGSVPGHNTRGQRLYQIPGMTPSLVNLPEGCAFSSRCPSVSSACAAQPKIEEPIPNRQVRCFHPHMQAFQEVST